MPRELCSSQVIRRMTARPMMCCITSRRVPCRWQTSSYGLKSLSIVGSTSTSTGGGSNQGQPLDINNDGSVSAIDALLVINYLNRGTATSTLSNPRLDVNRDTFVSALDALLVINYLNRQVVEQGQVRAEGEGERWRRTAIRVRR